MELSNNPGYLLLHLAFTMSRQNDQMLQERLGVGFSQFKILMVLESNPHIRQRQIAEALGQTEASISRQIRLMTESGLLRAQPSIHNKREHITALTAKGVRVVEEAMAVLNSYYGPTFSRLSERQQQQLLDSLMIMHEDICRSGKTAACQQTFGITSSRRLT